MDKLEKTLKAIDTLKAAAYVRNAGYPLDEESSYATCNQGDAFDLAKFEEHLKASGITTLVIDENTTEEQFREVIDNILKSNH